MSVIAMICQQPYNFRVADYYRPLLERRNGLTQDSFQEGLGASGAGHADEYWPHTRLGGELECQEGAALPFCHNQFGYSRNPFAIAGKAESIAVREFLGIDHSRPKLGKERCLTLAQFRARQTASYRHVIRAILHGRLAGGTTPFMRRYSTICP
jgi:hypothetical protein